MEAVLDDAMLAYSSNFVCDRIADRTVREMKGHTSAVASKFSSLMAPIVRDIASGGMRRGQLLPSMTRLKAQLDLEPAVAMAELLNLTPSRLSTHEMAHLRFCLMIGEETGEWIDFLACDSTATRKSLKMAVGGIDTRINRHALSRYMSRERKAPENLLHELMPVLKMAPLLAASAAQFEERSIAWPLGDGMLLGKFYVLDKDKDPPITVRTHFTTASHTLKDGEEIVERNTFVRGARIVVHFITYVDAASMFSEREEPLHRALTEYQNTYYDFADAVFNAYNFDAEIAPTRDIVSLIAEVDSAYRDANELVHSPVWRNFATTAGKGSRPKE